MNEEQLTEFLRNNLRIELDAYSDYGYGDETDNYLSVEIKLGDVIVTSSTVRID